MREQNPQPTLQPPLSAETDGSTTHKKVLDAETELPAYPAAFTLGTDRHVNSEPVLDSGRKLRISYSSLKFFLKPNDFSCRTGPQLRS